MNYQYFTKPQNYIFITIRQVFTTKFIKKYHKSQRKSIKMKQNSPIILRGPLMTKV